METGKSKPYDRTFGGTLEPLHCPRCDYYFHPKGEKQPILKKEWNMTSPRSLNKLFIQLWKCPFCKKTWRKYLK